MNPTAAAVRIERVRSREALEAFIGFPYRLHASTPRWIPPLRRDQRTLLDRLKHPFHDHAQVEYFLALRGGSIAGRMAAIENFAHNKFHGERAGFFGFLDAEDDAEVFAALLGAAEEWAAARGLAALRGPCSFSTNEECGLLVQNFDDDPMLMMPFNPPHYAGHVEAAGYRKAEDLLCHWMTFHEVPARIERLASAAERRLERAGARVRIRPLDMRRWDDEIATIKSLYEKAWERNWGFVPMTRREMDFAARELRALVNPDLIVFAEVDGEPVAMLVALPDFNQVLKHLGGRLGPVGVLKFLRLRRRIGRMRMLMMGVLPAFRGRGLEIMMYRQMGHGAIKAGISALEMSWILERNEPANHQAAAFGGTMYRRYRIYEKALGRQP